MRLAIRAVLTFVALSIAAPVSAARVHPRLVKSTPAADSRSAQAPLAVALSFNETLDLELTRVTILRGEAQVSPDSVHLAAGDNKTVVAVFGSALAAGRYTIRWQVTGADGHPVRGQFSFEILAPSATSSRPARR